MECVVEGSASSEWNSGTRLLSHDVPGLGNQLILATNRWIYPEATL